jgi:hypothetical protein
MKSNTSVKKASVGNENTKVMKLKDLGIEVVTVKETALNLARPIRHIRAMDAV